MSVDVERELPEYVITFGGESRHYHRQDPERSEPAAMCGTTSENSYRKERALIESHYEPCGNCFPQA